MSWIDRGRAEYPGYSRPLKREARMAPTLAMSMSKAWPAMASALNDQLDSAYWIAYFLQNLKEISEGAHINRVGLIWGARNYFGESGLG